MDNYRIPRKVNRHVLKAIESITQAENVKHAEFSDIVNYVNYSMRNLRPVLRLEEAIKSSLHNLTKLNMLSVNKSNNSYAILDKHEILEKFTKPADDSTKAEIFPE